ncbi:internalin_N-terminal domain-containing protein [Hexamita inflata]|uniref:Internalin N-terminal domain-containing protein n=1 Tax=Hexamita inflata TaxID=28002 RepID=A0AA86NI92_9EUKA|nr:internalin N-terminal domain-containing protein [Hexamita inflata]
MQQIIQKYLNQEKKQQIFVQYEKQLSNLRFMNNYAVKYLFIQDCQVEIDQFFEGFPQQVTTFQLQRCELIQINGIQLITGVTNLDLSDNQLVDISPLQSLIQLKSLKLNCNEIQIVDSLCYLTNLTQLDLSFTDVTESVIYQRYVFQLTQVNLTSARTRQNNQILCAIYLIYNH